MRKQVTVKIILDKRYDKKNSDNYPAKLRVTYEKKQVYFKTKFSFTEAIWKKMKGSRPDQLKEILEELQEIEKAARKIVEKMPVFSFDTFKKKYFNYSATTTINGAFEAYSKELRSKEQIGNAINYECASKSFTKFRPEALLSDVNKDFLDDYVTWMTNKNKSITTQSMYLRALRCIVKKAKDAGDYTEPYPFGEGKFQIPEARVFKRSLKEQQLASVINYECSGATGKARDFWYLMYLCEGVNVQDLCLWKYSNIKGKYLEFYRSKTFRTKKVKTPIQIFITPAIRFLLDKYGQGGNGYIFPILNELNSFPESKNVERAERKKQLIQYFTRWLNDHIKEIATDLKIDISLTTYVSRHSWATQMLRSGISISAISKKMHDGNINTTTNYLDSLSEDQLIEMANAATSFKNKPLGKVVNL